jgi:hypothetical protein
MQRQQRDARESKRLHGGVLAVEAVVTGQRLGVARGHGGVYGERDTLQQSGDGEQHHRAVWHLQTRERNM